MYNFWFHKDSTTKIAWGLLNYWVFMQKIEDGKFFFQDQGAIVLFLFDTVATECIE